MRLADLLGRLDPAVAPTLEAGDAGVNVTDITEDSRTALPGSLFIARRGLTVDGRRFIDDAVDAGARAVATDDWQTARETARTHPTVAVLLSGDLPLAAAHLAEAFFGAPSASLHLIGVTGTNGKTSVATIAHRLLNAAGVRTGLIGTVDIDDGRETAPAEMTTPPALELSRTLAAMVESGCRAAVMEVSSHALDQRRPAALAFDAAIFTNLSGDHLDYHRTMDEYARAKQRLFALLAARAGRAPSPDPVPGPVHRPGHQPGPAAKGLAIVNDADPRSATMLEPVRRSRAIATCRVGEGRGAGLRVETRGADLAGLDLRIAGAAAGIPLDLAARVGLIGGHNAMNTAQAIAAAAHAIASLEPDAGDINARLTRGLTLVRTARGRLDAVYGASDDVRVFVDFAHTDAAIDSMLAGVRPLVRPPAALWLVFGAGGRKDTSKRPRMGLAAARGADRVVITSDNPRGESPGAIITDILAGVPDDLRHKAEVQADRRRAIAFAIAHASSGDVVIIAGKGHEEYQELTVDGVNAAARVPFSDFEEARAALASRRANTRAATR